MASSLPVSRAILFGVKDRYLLDFYSKKNAFRFSLPDEPNQKPRAKEFVETYMPSTFINPPGITSVDLIESLFYVGYRDAPGKLWGDGNIILGNSVLHMD